MHAAKNNEKLPNMGGAPMLGNFSLFFNWPEGWWLSYLNSFTFQHFNGLLEI